MVFNSGKITLKENLKPFVPNAPLLFPMHPFVPKPFVPNLPLKTRFSDVFREKKRGALGTNGLKCSLFQIPFSAWFGSDSSWIIALILTNWWLLIIGISILVSTWIILLTAQIHCLIIFTYWDIGQLYLFLFQLTS